MSKVDNYILVFYSKGQSLTVLLFSCSQIGRQLAWPFHGTSNVIFVSS